MSFKRFGRASLLRALLPAFALYFIEASYGQSQPFNSNSTGADGALTYPANSGLVSFPPTSLGARPNNIYNFTTITIGAGTTVRLSGWVLSGPVYWLAQGDVTINGTLDLTGQSGHQGGNAANRIPSEPGAGGYSGGVGHATNSSGQNATKGNGPGGGTDNAGTLNSVVYGGGGKFIGSGYLVPLVAGSGGGGGCGTLVNYSCGGGGGGGGAILIASSTKIVNSGKISVDGGAGTSYGGGGSGGAVRLVANQITNGDVISGSLVDAIGGDGGACCDGGGGRLNSGAGGTVRFEAFTIQAGSVRAGVFLTSPPFSLALPGGASTVTVTSVNGMPINANPFTFPDATITTTSPVPVVVAGTNIPPGTTGTLYIYSEATPDQAIPFTLTGSLQSTTATVNVAYPSGGSRGFAKVTWMQ